MATVQYQLSGATAVISVDNPPVNAFSHVVRVGIGEALQRAFADPAVRAIVVLGMGKTFFAGADIREFEKRFERPRVRDLQDMLDAANKPVIAAIHGTAFGGGLEFALTCHWRVALASAQVGLPEIKLGLMPGAGGTQRLPRLIGVEAAFDIIYSGNPVAAARAHELGIIDALVEGGDYEALRRGALAFADSLCSEKVVADNKPLRAISGDNSLIATTDAAVFAALRKKIAKKAVGQIAPEKIIQSLEAACRLPFLEGLEFEQQCFQACYDSPQHYAMQHLFFAEREARKIPDVGSDVKALPIRSAAVIGAGNMGGGITMCFANAGIPVTVVDVSSEAVQRGRAIIEKNYAASVARGSLSEQKMAAALQLISGSTDYASLQNVDIVIEAAFEDMQIKQKIFADLDRVVAPHTILASNTSTLDIDAIASATQRPDKVIGTHFFVPANVMKLLENVRGVKSSKQTIATAMELGKRMGKVSVLAGNCDGFIGNRMWQFYTSESEFLLEDGATPEQVDRVVEAFGMPMGPFAMRDLSGNDIGLKVRKLREQKYESGERFPKILERVVERGWFGQKTGKGFYDYADRQRTPNREAVQLIEEVSAELGIARRAVSDEEILARLLHPLINEGAKALEDGIASRASDIDIVFVNGYGFPAYRGGPMYWAQQIGLDKVLATNEMLGEKHGPRWQPAQLLRRLVKENKGWAG